MGKKITEQEYKNDVLWIYEIDEDKHGNKARRLIEKRYSITDDIGLQSVIEKSNGSIIKLLKVPSKKYKDKAIKRTKKFREEMALKEIENAKEKLITDKMREMAISALKDEGKL